MRKLLVMTTVAALSLSACGSDTSGPTPGGPDGLLIRIEHVGGFVPIEVAASRGPTFTLTTDGKLVAPGAVNAIYPGPLVFPNFESQLISSEMSQIQTLIERIGLPGMDDEVEDDLSGFLADATTTVITYWDSNGEHRFSVYGLGVGDSFSEAARTLVELQDTLQDLTWERQPSPYVPEKVQVLVGESMQDVDEMFVDVRPWPLPETDITSWPEVTAGWRCATFGPEVLDVLESATQVTTWVNPNATDEVLTIIARALHPGEDDCH